MSKKVCISGYYGFDNFGDETILSILIENIKKFDNAPEITVFSSNPAKTASSYNVKSVNSFNIKDIIISLFKSDCLISGGGSLLQDVTSAKSLIYYLGILCLAQLFRKKTIIFAQGIGPINNKILAKITKCVLKNSSYVTVRDDRSLSLLHDWNINAIKCSDPAWNITNAPRIKTNKIGIQLRNFRSVTPEFIKQLAVSVNKYYGTKEICILSLQNNIDLDVCIRLKEELININPHLKIDVIQNDSINKVIASISQTEELIAMRYHACLIAIKSGIKVLPINYDIKVETLAKEFETDIINPDFPEQIDSIVRKFLNTQYNYDKDKIDSHKFNFKALESII